MLHSVNKHYGYNKPFYAMSNVLQVARKSIQSIDKTIKKNYNVIDKNCCK